MAVPEDDEARAPHPGRLHILSAVNHPKRKAGQFSVQGEWQLLGLRPRVRVPAHSIDRRDLSELVKDIHTSHVAGMENPITSGEELQDPRPQEAMGIGEDPDAHGGEDTAAESVTRTVSRPVTLDLCKSVG